MSFWLILKLIYYLRKVKEKLLFDSLDALNVYYSLGLARLESGRLIAHLIWVAPE